MNLDELTLGQVKQLLAQFGASQKASEKTEFPEKPWVIVRAYSGVFFGRLVWKSNTSCELHDARQIWAWDSSGLQEPVCTTGDIALRGVGSRSKVSSPVATKLIENGSNGWAVDFASVDAVRVIGAQKWAR